MEGEVKPVDFVRQYYDICKEIEITELRLLDLENDLKEARNLISTCRLPSGHHTVHVPLDEALRRYDDVCDKIRHESIVLERKRMMRRQIEDSLRGLKGIDYQVAYMRDILNMPLAIIAKELGYTLGHIKNVSSRIRKIKRDDFLVTHKSK